MQVIYECGPFICQYSAQPLESGHGSTEPSRKYLNPRKDVVMFPGRPNALSFESDLCHLVGRGPLGEKEEVLMKQNRTTYAP